MYIFLFDQKNSLYFLFTFYLLHHFVELSYLREILLISVEKLVCIDYYVFL